MSQVETGSVTLYLLDAAQGHAIQTWHFKDRTTVTIGRMPENDIAIVDPQVSRRHLELRFAGGAWTLVTLGRNGTLVNGKNVTEIVLNEHWVFQLGATGPTFKFVSKQDSADVRATIANIEEGLLDLLFIDQEKKQHEVQQIVDAETFKLLEMQVRQFKQQSNFEKTDHENELNR